MRKRLRRVGEYAGRALYVVERLEAGAEESGWSGLYCFGQLQPLAIVIAIGDSSVVVDCEGKPIEAEALLTEIDQLKVALLDSENKN